LSELLDSLGVSKNSLLAVNGNGSPTILYFSERKGWNPSDKDLQSAEFIQQLKAKGCECIVICKSMYNDFTIDRLTQIYDDKTFRVYALK